VLTVTAAVHHAELIAHRVGEPFGTLILALCVTVIEAGLILSLMLGGKGDVSTLARDTVFAAVMLILNALLGICLLIGGLRHREQNFVQEGVSAALAALGTLTVLTLVLPNYTTSAPGPTYSGEQLGFIALVSLILYGAFVAVQTVRHRDYFLPPSGVALDEDRHAEPPSQRAALAAFVLLLVSLGAVILLAKALSPTIRALVSATPHPEPVVGIAVAAIVLMPEGFAAVRAALANRIQASLNLALGSALATIGLTIPAVAIAALLFDLPVSWGLDMKGIVLLGLTLLVATLSLGVGRTTVLQGVIHLVIFAVFLFTAIVP
jgi:Ca2+:H+ antiporter